MLKRVNRNIEREIIIALITSDQYIKNINRIYKPHFLLSDSARKLASWCFEYYSRYSKAPKKDIERIYTDRLKEGLNPEEGEGIERILEGLSKQYEESEDFNVDYLLERTVKYFQESAAQNLHDQQAQALENGDIDRYYELYNSFKIITETDLFEDESINAGELYDMEIKKPKWLVNPSSTII